VTEIERQIAEEILQHGHVSASRFMEIALYCPVLGFYEKEADTIGRRGHFMTSVSVGPLFGELLAFAFSGWIDQFPATCANPLLVEAGAHDAKLASDILGWYERHRPDLAQRLSYVIIEPSERRREWQATRLGALASFVSWVDKIEALNSLPAAQKPGGSGIIFSNEFLDAFPVHRLAWNRARGQWVEHCVTMKTAPLPPTPSQVGTLAGPIRASTSSPISPCFEWCETEIENTELAASLPQAGHHLLEHLPDGYIVEVSPAAAQWWATAARVLPSGYLLACDYGVSHEDQFSPARTGGTLRAYRHHQCSTRVLETPGEQDLTAHVNFPQIIKAGEAAGLKTEQFQTQGRFLARLATEIPQASSFAPPWDHGRTRQFATLTHPNHLGHAFKILVQRKD
jgi:SAM-dependent MidA family methyltransferase